MPNVVSQRADENGLYIRSSQGVEVTITNLEIMAHHNNTPGTPSEQRLDTRSWIKNRIEQILGEDSVPYESIEVDYDPTENGRVTVLTLM